MRLSQLLIWFFLTIRAVSFLIQTPLAYRKSLTSSSRWSNFSLKSTKKQTDAATTVIYQKVVKPSPSMSETLFLGYLVEYLQDIFELPEGLPMVYEKHTETSESNSLIQWDSSLSPNPKATRLYVETVGIFTEEKSRLPGMAMVVVRKDDTRHFKNLPQMLQNLFADSESRILRALEGGLNDFINGKIVFSSPKEDQPLASQARQDMLSEIMPDEPPTATDNDVIDAIVEEPEKSDKVEPAKENTTPDDFAVHAAREKASQTTKPAESIPQVDFAVRAAQKAAERRRNKDFAVRAAREVMLSSHPETKEPKSTEPEIQVESIRPPMLDSVVGPRKFRQTFSTPMDFNQRQLHMQQKADTLLPKEDTKSQSQGDNSGAGGETKEETKTDSREVSPQAGGKTGIGGPLKVEVDSEVGALQDNDQALQREIVDGVRDALDEVAAAGEELTPEELLSRVMEFGDQQDREEKVGDGFVSGAFEKAKDILREQRDRRQTRVQESNEPRTEFRELSQEEELRRMFEAGERIADGRITRADVDDIENSSLSNRGTTDRDIDGIIAADRTISDHARVLDDELTELELRINRSPDEATDAPRENPIFDILSGPEVYNPNVSPETVNWPGAAKGTKVVRLPKELDEAVRQASFAAEILVKVAQEIENNHGNNGMQNVTIGGKTLSADQISHLEDLVNEAVEIGIIDDPASRITESARLQMLVDELWSQPEERVQEVASSFKDLLLSENFVLLIKERLAAMADRDLDALRHDDNSLEEAHGREREILGQLVVYTQLLLKETRALGAELEAQQLEVIRSICKVAMNPSHKTEEEAAIALTDTVRDMRPLFDDAFVAYLKYAVAEEEAKLARAGVLDDPDHNRWLYVLKIVQQGVYTEISRSISRYIDHLGYVLRMETATERRALLSQIIDVMPTLDVRPFVQVVDNIVGALGDSSKGDFTGIDCLGGMTNELLQLSRDMKELLPPERIALMSKDADEWAAKQKKRLLEQRRMTKQRLTAARQTEHLDEEIDSLGRQGEVDRMD